MNLSIDATDPVVTRPRSGYHTATLGKGLEVLEALSHLESASLTELSRNLGFTSPTLFRILATLVDCGFVTKSVRDSRYRLSLRSWEIGVRAMARISPREVALGRMEALAAELNESPHLAVLEGSGVVILEKVECRQPIRVETYVGLRAPAFCSAMGKAILAYRKESDLEEHVAEPLIPYTENTLVRREDLLRELARVREQGYATNRSEWHAGVCALAVPLFEADRSVRSALSVTMPTERFSEERLHELLLPELQRAAADISRDLGGRPPRR
ncbi:IclR family transcriptional regulator [Aquibaculum arenosum]|uniref:IclR family transcriptional regulator n=1 Tax=Aquibaculum arenosum TaxID=3032591 RepID=A0ABT5YP37_9PROT|nr:IclR family transcriptional regulator [Fodinicurvata sp. CAU 1616]MDF2096725.1 IclR family transcriptional regulator [Fodinicurvata sp. CAU 1616]